MLMVVVSSSCPQDPLWVIFMSANMLLHLSFSSLVCNFRLHPNLPSIMPFTYVRYYFFDLFVTPKIIKFYQARSAFIFFLN